MRITIITICYNSADFIEDCLISVLHQTYSDIEYIIVDGNSSDGTKEIIQRFGDKITKFVSEPDKGIYDALNKGILLANGDVIGFLHADDMFASEQTLQHISEVFRSSNPGTEETKPVDVVYGDLVLVDKQNVNHVVRYWVSRPYKQGLLARGWMPPHPTVFMRREVYKKHGFFNTDLKCSADYDFILRVFSDESLVFRYLPEIITRMRMGGMSTKGLKQIFQKKIEDYWVLKSNHMPFPLWILLAKNIIKIPQLIFRKSRGHQAF